MAELDAAKHPLSSCRKGKCFDLNKIRCEKKGCMDNAGQAVIPRSNNSVIPDHSCTNLQSIFFLLE